MLSIRTNTAPIPKITLLFNRKPTNTKAAAITAHTITNNICLLLSILAYGRGARAWREEVRGTSTAGEASKGELASAKLVRRRLTSSILVRFQHRVIYLVFHSTHTANKAITMVTK